MFFCKLFDLFLITDSNSRQSLDFVDEVSQSSLIDSMNLNEQEIETINETTNKTAANELISVKQIDKHSVIRKYFFIF